MPHVAGTVGDTNPDINAQRQWVQTYLSRPNDYYYIIESIRGKPLGTIGIYNFSGQSAEWGRWIILPGVGAALPSAVLVHELAFGKLELQELRGSVVTGNTKVVSFHRRFGAEELGVETAARVIAGRSIDLTWFRVEKSSWPKLLEKNIKLAETAARSLASL
jgi:RimJ/RimL family protein N-acetyltransferase